jgi:hypothetical protein
MINYTISKNGDAATTFAARGLMWSDWTRKPSDLCTVNLTGPTTAITATRIFEYGDTLEIFAAGTTDAGQTINRRLFYGRCIRPADDAPAGANRQLYQFANAWWWLTQIIYEQTYKTGPSTTTTSPFCNLFWDQATDAARSNGAEITAIINWAIAAGAPLQLGTVDLATTPAPDAVNSQTCAQTIQRAMNWTPDSVAWIDDATTPPTFHCRQRANLTAVTKAITHFEPPISLTPRHDLVPAYVRIAYHYGTDDGTAPVAVDKYPVAADETQFPRLRLAVQLGFAGGAPPQNQWLKTAAVNYTSSDWWLKARFADNPTIADLTIIGTPAIANESAHGKSFTTPMYEVIEGAVPGWKIAEETAGEAIVVITATVSYNVKIDSATVLTVPSREISVRLRCTDLSQPTGYNYTKTSVPDSEAVPAGVAQSLFESAAALHQEGTLNHHGKATLDLDLQLGTVLNLTGGRAEWATGRLLPAQITCDPSRSLTTVAVGPPAHLGIGELIDLIRAARARNNPTMISLQTTGTTTTGAQNLPTGTAVRSHSDSPATPSKFTVQTSTGTKTIIIEADGTKITLTDADGKTVTLDAENSHVTVDDAAGVSAALDVENQKIYLTDGSKTIECALADLPAGGEAKFREVTVCVDGVAKTAWVLMTTPEDI